ncbi:outer membrane protein, partial [Porphyrobacter sp. AAP82]|uniref:outer membrane protein n=1 Tax=Porphyrobacter sp. AAP82 TaxID=1248917 RepID=UPI0003666665
MKSTRFLLVGAAAAAIAAPAQADGPYFGVEGGVSLRDKVTLDVDVPPADGSFERAATARTKIGIDGDVILGYDFGAFRLEAEGGYKNAKYRSLTVENTGILPTGSTVPVGTVVDNRRDLEIWSAMVNALVEIGADDGLRVYGGGGAGVARLELPVEVAGVGTLVDDKQTDFAWQLIGGLRFAVTRNIDLGVKYRYFNIDDFSLTGTNGNGLEADYSAHSVLASVIVNFGGRAQEAPEPAPVAAPVAAPPPPPPP